MCGIVGYIGEKQALPIIIDALKRLEYRGYDSAGVAVLVDGSVEIIKTAGKIRALEELLSSRSISTTMGVGHTRWATHGEPSTANAHPHCDCSGRVAIAHNGIIENYLSLREELQAKGHRFTSETDTEVIAHLVEENLRDGNLESALRSAIRRLQGSYAIVAMNQEEPERLLVARKDSPLVIGLSEGANFVASDIPAVLPYTRRVYILEDEDIGIVTREGITLSNEGGDPVSREEFAVTWDAEEAEKGGYEHFMLKEIHEIPRAIRDTMRTRVTDDNRLNLEEIKLSEEEIRSLDRIFIIACGTAYYAGCVGKSIFERLLRIPVEVDIASEFRYRNPIFSENSLAIIISQSGETADTIAAMREARRGGVKALGIVNAIGSSIYREADCIIPTWAGPEICVASTKAYTSQLIALYLIALHFAQVRGRLSVEEVACLLAEMKHLPEQVQRIFDREDKIAALAEQEELKQCRDFFFLGRGLDYSASLEGALKLKEISYIHSEAAAAGELKHGPLALITKGMPVMAICVQQELRGKMLSNIKEVAARGAHIIGLVKESDSETEKAVAEVIRIPENDELFMPVLTIIPTYLLTYYLSKALGREIDQPRNLAKSVTVE
ncbi:MAG: glutamine--fructose-6-phosphate transaminase (isomerizing) [Armatimonadetes bacterium]|nr:glutamine--fructose-6-phosphate transaminase (isomerizing) [Armatimonadota bacterium]NIM24953.1 glutamine--fructose-6-phosphate transaminase (isomerizing) [Armatimonadota bacterium]NIM68839.1 glutamine--fructose-6-phosphate transaminase (isomerizing) [Armatimonadota bacterium]NIM76665.1 glutamine--fructose-6-phosphate transaminase (isomerizing) [Armatimonadota bacterium]NIN07044.1 glutamine--fructose-6-phosphate transaminase (isomerizing) [Armatimonadota bacterium]